MLLPGKVDEGPSCPFLFRQTPLCNLNLDEINRQMGDLHKPFNAYNMDELVKNVIPHDEAPSMQKSSSSASSSSSSSTTFLKNFNLNKPFSKKSIDEVWHDVADQDCAMDAFQHPPSTRQSTLGETTLEDFLLCTGVISLNNQENVVNPQPLSEVDSMILLKQHEHEQRPQQLNMMQEGDHQMSEFHHVQDVMSNNEVIGAANYLDHQLELPFPLQKGFDDATCSDPHSRLLARKARFKDEMMEKSIERRQRRMINNRESAARSRARKQAHTKSMEQDVLRLRAMNDWLKKRKEVEKILDSNSTPGPKYQLRRTSSAAI